jgi:hypothetical protein
MLICFSAAFIAHRRVVQRSLLYAQTTTVAEFVRYLLRLTSSWFSSMRELITNADRRRMHAPAQRYPVAAGPGWAGHLLMKQQSARLPATARMTKWLSERLGI